MQSVGVDDYGSVKVGFGGSCDLEGAILAIWVCSVEY
jgi:hypothetical protein